MHSPRKRYNLSPPLEHLSTDTCASEDGSCHMNNGNSFSSVSNVNGNDTAYCLHICAHSDVNLDKRTLTFINEKLNQQYTLMGHELTSNIDFQETQNDVGGCSEKDRISKTSTLLSSQSLIVLSRCSVNNRKYIRTPSCEQEAKIHHTVDAEVIHSAMNCNAVMSSVPNNIATVLKNPVNVCERKLSLSGIQANLHVCDRFLVYERELVFVLQRSDISIHRDTFLQSTMDIGQSPNYVFPDYLQHIFIKTDTDICSVGKFLENCSSTINTQHVPDSGSYKTHTVPDISYTSEISASENCCMQSEVYGMLAVALGVVNNYHSDVVKDGVCKFVRDSEFSCIQQRRSLQTINTFWSALLTVLHTPLCINYINCFNMLYLWQEADKNLMLETYNARSKSSHYQTASIKNSNSNTFQKHSRPLADCISFNESSIQTNSGETLELSDDRKLICEDSSDLQPSTVLQEDTVTAESRLSASSEQHSHHSDRNKPSNIIMQKKLTSADLMYDSCDCTRDSSDATVNGCRGHSIIKCQKIRSLSQPSIPTYLLYDSTDDEQFLENSDDESDCLSETLREYGDIYGENISEWMVAKGESKHTDMPYSTINVAAHETTYSNQNVYMLQSDHLYNNAVTEFKADVTLTELCDKSQKLLMKDDKLRFCEQRKLSYPLKPKIDTSNNDHQVPFGTTQDANVLDIEGRNILQMESEISQNIIVIEDGVNERECPSYDKQHFVVPLSHTQIFRQHKVIPDGSVQCNVCTLPDIADSWNISGNEICSEEAEARMLLECSSSSFARDADIQCTWVSDTNEHKIQNERTATLTHEAREKACHFTVAHTRTDNRCEPCTGRHSIHSQECITVKEPQIFTRPDSRNIVCGNGNDVSHQQLPDQNHVVIPNSSPEPLPNYCKDSCDQKQPVCHPCVENCHSHKQMHQVYNRSPKNTLISCNDIAIKKYETDIPRESCYTAVKSTEDAAVQTNIRSVITLGTQNGCFVCFSRNHVSSNGFKTGTHHSLASKRNLEALDLEYFSLHKRPRYDTLKSVYLESDISELPANLNSNSEKLETPAPSFPDNSNEESDFQSMEHLDELQDTSVMDRQDFVDSDQKVPDVARNISWMEDGMNDNELYVRDQIMKAPSKREHVFEWHNQYQFPKASKNNTKETAYQSHASVKRSIRVGLSKRAQPLPLHPHYPRQSIKEFVI